MKNKIIFIFSLASLIFMLSSCDLIFNVASSLVGGGTSSGNNSSNGESQPSLSPLSSIKKAAYDRAVYYVGQYTKYVDGKSGRMIYPFDCSGFVERCYEEALLNTEYKLPFNIPINSHYSAQDLYNRFTFHIDKNGTPEKGDLVFLDFERRKSDKHITHIGIVQGIDSKGILHFIDATNYEGYDKVVDYRRIKRNDNAVVAYGEMKLVKR